MLGERGVGAAAVRVLDRDGVLNVKSPEGSYVTSREDFVWLPDAVPALARLSRAGVRLVVVTNQRGVALGRLAEADLDEIHTAMSDDIRAAGGTIAAIYTCTHDRDTCDCRKPGIGLFLQAAADDPSLDLADSALVGDSVSDVEAGSRLGIPTYLVGSDAERVARDATRRGLRVDAWYPSLARLVDAFDAPGTHAGRS